VATQQSTACRRPMQPVLATAGAVIEEVGGIRLVSLPGT
jgi:hypothetical protein